MSTPADHLAHARKMVELAMKKLTSTNYIQDQLYPVVARPVAEILKTSAVVAPVEVFFILRMQRITKQQLENWRFGWIEYLERVTVGGLGKLSRILRILELHARTLNLKPSQTVYHKWGKGGKRILLRFSKSGDRNLEAAYSRHYVAKNHTNGKSDVDNGEIQLDRVGNGHDELNEIAGVEQRAECNGNTGT